MNDQVRAGVSYVACRLITGRRIRTLFSLADDRMIDMAALADSGLLRDFDAQHEGYIPGYANDCTCRFSAENGRSLEIFVNSRTFIAHVCGSQAYFIGTIRGDTIYLYDHHESLHLRYRISSFADDPVSHKTAAHRSSPG